MKTNKMIYDALVLMMNEWSEIDKEMTKVCFEQVEMANQGKDQNEEYFSRDRLWSTLYDKREEKELEIIRKFNECFSDENVQFNESGYFWLVRSSIECIGRIYDNMDESMKKDITIRS